MFKRLKEDIAAVKEKDPAARSSLEIYFLYSLREFLLHGKVRFLSI